MWLYCYVSRYEALGRVNEYTLRSQPLCVSWLQPSEHAQTRSESLSSSNRWVTRHVGATLGEEGQSRGRLQRTQPSCGWGPGAQEGHSKCSWGEFTKERIK